MSILCNMIINIIYATCVIVFVIILKLILQYICNKNGIYSRYKKSDPHRPYIIKVTIIDELRHDIKYYEIYRNLIKKNMLNILNNNVYRIYENGMSKTTYYLTSEYGIIIHNKNEIKFISNIANNKYPYPEISYSHYYDSEFMIMKN